MRKTSRQRDEIRDILMETTSHPTAEWVYEKVKPRIPKISLATVYRNLTLLVAEGKAQKIRADEGPDRFDATTENHYHFSCSECGNVYDVDYPIIPDFEENVSISTGFEIKNHSIIFSGVCKNCRSKN